MSDSTTDDLFGAYGDDEPDLFGQEGPDLFGAEPDELIITHEPDHVVDLDIDLDEDTFDEIPIDPDDPSADDEGEPTVVLQLPPSAPSHTVTRPDAPLALYRRYRPDTFADVIGQDHVTEPLQRALVNNRVNHAYLFSGPRGCGKTTSARILARCLNCEQGPTPEPCGECMSCRDLARGGPGSIDVIEIDAASHGGVNEARDLRERAFFAPVHSRYKIYIIDEAHMVTKEGFNALLKLVEEPPPHVKFIFATTEPEKVLGTIRSRTHHYPFRLVPPKVLAAYLDQLCTAEGVPVDKAVLPLVVRAGAGSVRDSLSVLDQLLGAAGEHGVSYRHATALLGYTPEGLLDEIMDAFAAGDAQGVFACIDKVIEVGQDPRRFAEDLLRRLRDLIIVAAVPDALTSGLVDVAGDQAERLTTQASGMGAGELTRAAEVIAKGLTDMRGTTAPRLHLELMCARVLLPGADVDARGIHARLDRLERRLNMVAEGGAVERPAVKPQPVQVAEPEGWAPAPSRQHPAEQRPGEQRPAERRPAEQPPAARPEAPVAVASDPGNLSTADVRRMWPQVLESVKGRRRVTWIILSQNAQVQSYADGVLTVALPNPGALESFGRGGSPDILREALIEVLGIAPRVEAVAVAAQSATPPHGQPAGQPAGQPTRTAQPTRRAQPDPGTQATQATQAAPPAPRHDAEPPPWDDEPPPDDDDLPPRPSPAAAAKQNIRRTQLSPTASAPEVEQRRDDDDLDSSDVGVDELLASQLGAELIYEDPTP